MHYGIPILYFIFSISLVPFTSFLCTFRTFTLMWSISQDSISDVLTFYLSFSMSNSGLIKLATSWPVFLFYYENLNHWFHSVLNCKKTPLHNKWFTYPKWNEYVSFLVDLKSRPKTILQKNILKFISLSNFLDSWRNQTNLNKIIL